MNNNIIITALCSLLLIFSSTNLHAADSEIEVIVNKKMVVAGIPFKVIVNIPQQSRAKLIDIEKSQDFNIEVHRGSIRWSENINGVSRSGIRTIVSFTALRTGNLTIPSFIYEINGKQYKTKAISIKSTKQAKGVSPLTIDINTPREIYIGQTVPIDIILYSTHELRNFKLNIPFIDSKQYSISGIPLKNIPSTNNDIIGYINNHSFYTRAEKRVKNDIAYDTVKIRLLLTANKAGTIALSPIKSMCTIIITKEFGSFGGLRMRQQTSEKTFAKSDSVPINVKLLPTAGKPDNFSGLIGRFRISDMVEPTEASVGEPMTLTVGITGAKYLDNVELPDLNAQPDMSKSFSIPNEISMGEVTGEIKQFTQTIRAKNASVKEVPPIELNYFNPETEQYETARTKAIPIKIKAAKLVTVSHIEGHQGISAEQEAITSTAGGIAANYVSYDCLQNQIHGIYSWLHNPGWLALLIIPPAGYILLLASLTVLHGREAGSDKRRASAAFNSFKAKTRNIAGTSEASTVLLEGLQEYFSARFGISSASLTFTDVCDKLAEKGINGKIKENLKKIFDHCEASRYAGGTVGNGVSEKFLTAVTALIDKIETRLK